MPDRPRVAVIGLGSCGITSVKNLLERGFDVTGFEGNDQIGGIWRFKEDPTQTCALKTTRTNASKQFAAFTDFPFPEDVPNYPTSQQVSDYLQAYAEHFDLFPHLRLHTPITSLTYERNDDAPSSATSSSTSEGERWDQDIRWKIHFKSITGDGVETFDRLIMATGPYAKGWRPEIPGATQFKGRTLHSQEYKGPSPFMGTRVLILGLGYTAADIAVDLLGTASEICVSHRAGACVLKREGNGRPADHEVSRRILNILYLAYKYLPSLANWFSSWYGLREMRQTWSEIDPKWGLIPFPPLDNVPPLLNEQLIPALQRGDIKSVGRVRRFERNSVHVELEPYSDTLRKVEVDTVIYATSARYDFSYLPSELDPTSRPSPEWDAAPNSNGVPYPRLWHNGISTQFPSSLAFQETSAGFSLSSFVSADVLSQAIAGLWSKPKIEMPHREEVEAWCDETYRYNLKRLSRHRILQIDTEPLAEERWLNEIAGTSLDEYLGWFSWKAWKFWWSDRELYSLIMDGVQTPFMFRLFPAKQGGRRTWSGARDAIFRANGKQPK